jgi:hypothetical protein
VSFKKINLKKNHPEEGGVDLIRIFYLSGLGIGIYSEFSWDCVVDPDQFEIQWGLCCGSGSIRNSVGIVLWIRINSNFSGDCVVDPDQFGIQWGLCCGSGSIRNSVGIVLWIRIHSEFSGDCVVDPDPFVIQWGIVLWIRINTGIQSGLCCESGFGYIAKQVEAT